MKKSDIEIALDHIDNLTKYFIDSSNLAKCSEEARQFSHAIRKKIMGTPEPDYDPLVQLPAGRYWIGDLCYVMHGDTKWREVCDVMAEGDEDFPEVYTLKDGTKFMYCSTAYGDGTYYDQHGNEYGVDAGIIGIISLNDIDGHPDNDISLGKVFTFDEPVTCGNHSGVLKFGNVNNIVSIDTTGGDEDDQY